MGRGSTYDPNALGEQIITGHLDVEWSIYEDELEPTSTVKAIARITLIGDGAIVPTIEPPTYSRQIYSGDFCQLGLFRRVSFRRKSHGRWRNG